MRQSRHLGMVPHYTQCYEENYRNAHYGWSYYNDSSYLDTKNGLKWFRWNQFPNQISLTTNFTTLGYGRTIVVTNGNGVIMHLDLNNLPEDFRYGNDIKFCLHSLWTGGNSGYFEDKFYWALARCDLVENSNNRLNVNIFNTGNFSVNVPPDFSEAKFKTVNGDWKQSGTATFDFFTTHNDEKNMKKKKNWFTKNDDNIFFLAWAQNTHGENFHIKPTQYWIYQGELNSRGIESVSDEYWSTGLYNLTGISYKLGYLK